MIVVVSGAVFLTKTAPVIGNSQLGMAELLWWSLLRTLDPGTMGSDEGSWFFLLSMLLVTVGGIFIVSMLIGIITNGIETRLDQLRRGRSLVIEEGHTIILGWSSQVFTMIAELVAAKELLPRSCVAILAPQDTLDMHEAIRERVKTGRTKIVCRTGSPVDLTDLEIINPHTAQSLIILDPDTENHDSYVIKVILALTNNPYRRDEPYHIVASIQNPKNLEVAHMVGSNETQIVHSWDLIARIIAQTCHQPGLSSVYSNLLTFENDDIYFREDPALVGKRFRDVVMAYEKSAVLGLRHANGTIDLLPSIDKVLESGDHVIAISEHSSTMIVSGLTDYGIERTAIRHPQGLIQSPKHTLVLGWNYYAPRVLNELDHYIPAGSQVMVVSTNTEVERDIAHTCHNLSNLVVSVSYGDTTDREILKELDLKRYHHVIVLSAYGEDSEQADEHTLITLLHLREIADTLNHSFSIVSEMRDSRNRELAEVTRADDFIVSNRIITMMMAQLSENKELVAVYDELFDPHGAELYLKPIEHYIEPGKSVNFYTLLEATMQHGEIAIGYRLGHYTNDVDQMYGITVNPRKSDSVIFSSGDTVIVLAED